MRSNSNEISTGAAILIVVGVLLVIGMIISAFEPKCSMSGCDNKAKEGSSYCHLHDMSYRSYGNPDYHEVYKNSQSKSNSASSSKSDGNTTSGSSTTKSDSNSGGDSGSSTDSKNSTGYSGNSSKSSRTYDSYDDGYEDIYFDDDYDWDRYDSDPDYASGVDDAMDELDW